MINLTEFKITNLSGSAIFIASLDNFLLANNAVDVDMFAVVNGNFNLEDVQENTELETLLQAGDIGIKDQDDGEFFTLFPLYGHMYTVICPITANTTENNWNPAGWYNAKIIKITTSGNQFFTGFQKTYHGDFKIIRNESSSTMSFLYNNANSLVENRLYPIERSTNNNKKYSAVVVHYDAIDIGVPFINEQVSGVYPYQYSDIPLIDWFDITSIVDNDLYGGYAADYVRATKEMAILFEALPGETEADKWAQCTLDEMRCLAKRMIIDDKVLRLQVYTKPQDENNFSTHADTSIGCRQNRVDAAKIHMGYLMTVPDRVDLFTTVALMLESFINVNDHSIITWMHSEDGFLAKPYYTADLENCFEQIVENGIY